MTDRIVTLEIDDGVATVTLNSPHNRNALSRVLRTQLLDALTEAERAPEARVVVLTHTGPVFCAGADLKESFADHPVDQHDGHYPQVLNRLWHLSKPVVGRIRGTARAGGVGLIAACDLAVVAEDVNFALSEVRIGVVPAIISAVILSRTHPAIQEYFLTGEPFGAPRAAALGLVARAVPAAELDEVVTRYVRMLQLGGPRALAATKKLLRDRGPQDLAGELARLGELSARYFASEEAAEGARAFFEKRRPTWVGGPADQEIQ